jgi:molybdate transport system substrate-binding protein
VNKIKPLPHIVASFAFWCLPAHAAELRVAVASNFKPTMEVVARRFEAETKTKIAVIGDSTGKLYTQIVNGAPFDLFFSADEAHIQRLVDEGLAIAEGSRVYATGTLVLVGRGEGYRGQDCLMALASGNFSKLAIANPRTAPYGAAAQQFLESKNLWATVFDKLVTGENISQATQFVLTGNADMGFLAKSLLLAAERDVDGCAWDVPAEWHQGLTQKAAMLKRTTLPELAQRFLSSFDLAPMQAILKSHGYR